MLDSNQLDAVLRTAALPFCQSVWYSRLGLSSILPVKGRLLCLELLERVRTLCTNFGTKSLHPSKTSKWYRSVPGVGEGICTPDLLIHSQAV